MKVNACADLIIKWGELFSKHDPVTFRGVVRRMETYDTLRELTDVEFDLVLAYLLGRLGLARRDDSIEAMYIVMCALHD